MTDLRQLDELKYKGKEFTLHYTTRSYLDITIEPTGFNLSVQSFDEPVTMSFKDQFLNDWLDHPIAYGAFENDKMLGFVEGTLETWNNRYRISNICIFDENVRHQGLGTLLMNQILEDAVKSGARMIVLETQSCNEAAIAFYRKFGFEIIGFDLYAYSNTDMKRHEIRIEMGKIL